MPKANSEKLPAPPWQVAVAVDDIPETGQHFDLVADAGVRAAVARVAGLRELSRLQASFDVKRHSAGGLHVTGVVSATVGQNCVVTLEPLTNEVEEAVDLVFVPKEPVAPEEGETVPRGRQMGRSGAVDRRFSRFGRARRRIPDPRARSLSAQAGCGFRAAAKPHVGRGAICRSRPSWPRIRRGASNRAGEPLFLSRCRIPTFRTWVIECRTRSALRSMRWGETTARPWSSPAPNWRWRATPHANSCSSAMPRRWRRWSTPSRSSRPRRGSSIPTSPCGWTTSRARRCARPLEIVDVAHHRRGQEGRGRHGGVGRQYRRADGDVEIRSQDAARHRAAGDRGAVADAARRIDRARCRRHDRRRCRASRRSRGDGRGDRADSVRPAAPDRWASQYRRRRGQGTGTGARGRPHPARRETCPISTIRASSKATISAAARSTSWSPKVLPAISRSRPRKARRASSANICGAP